jgi:hypothetical protein
MNFTAIIKSSLGQLAIANSVWRLSSKRNLPPIT